MPACVGRAQLVEQEYRMYPPIAQLVELLPLKEKVVGSNPTGRTEAKRKDAQRKTLGVFR